MAIAGYPSNKDDETEVVDTTSQIKANVKINDVSPTKTPWVDTVAGYEGENLNYQVAGSPWCGNYYQQLKELGDVGDTIDARIDSSYQQYTKINNYVGKLEGSLTFSTTEDSKESSLSGSMILVDTLIPNRGDLWVAERGVNKVGLFAVTKTERLSAFSGSGYRVDLLLIEESDNNSKGRRYTSLENKVVSNYYYNENYLYLGTAPTLNSEDIRRYEERTLIAEQLANDYIREFFDRTSATLVLNLDGGIIYDPYLLNFITKTFKVNISNVRVYQSGNTLPETIWGNLIRRKSFMSNFIMKDVILGSTMQQQDLQFLYGVHHAGINFIVSPKDTADKSIANDAVYLGYGCVQSMSTVELRHLVNIPSNAVDTTIPPVPNLGIDSSYVLSTAWYNGDTELSILESMVTDWLQGNPLDKAKMNAVLETSCKFTELQRFYFNPIIIFILNNS